MTDYFAREALHSVSVSSWSRDRLGFIADENQKPFLDSESMDELLLWCRQSGKTQSAAVKISHKAIYVPRSLQLVVSASQRQAGILQRRVTDAMRLVNMGIAEHVVRTLELPSNLFDPDSHVVKCSVLQLELANGSAVVSVPASPDTVRGYSPDDIYMDEASRIPDPVYEAVRPMRASKPVRLTMMSTPAGKRGFFFSTWEGEGSPGHRKQDTRWTRRKVTAADCPRISKAFLEGERRGMMDLIYRQEYECEFTELAGRLFSDEMIASMFSDGVQPMASVEAWTRQLVGGEAW